MKIFNIDIKRYKCVNIAEEPKYIVDVNDDFCENPVEVGAIFNIEKGDVNEVEIVQVIGKDKINKLLSNLYALNLLKQYNKDFLTIRDIIKISRKIPLYSIIRPINGFTVNDQLNLIEAIMKDKTNTIIPGI